jgi:hypothetical protein
LVLIPVLSPTVVGLITFAIRTLRVTLVDEASSILVKVMVNLAGTGGLAKLLP